MHLRQFLLLLGCLLGLSCSAAVSAQDILPVPPLSARVIDQTSTLDENQRQALEDKLAALESSTGAQVVILLVPTTAPEDIASYAQRVADQWKIGRREVGDGVLIVSAQGDRRIRIEVAKTLEGAIPDLGAKRIIDGQITPAFRKGDFAGGLNAAVDSVAALIRGEALPAVSAKGGTSGGGLDLGALAMFFFVGVPLVGGVLSAIVGRKLGSLLTAAGVGGAGWLLTSSLLLAGVASVLAIGLVGVLGVGVGRRSSAPIIWGGGMGGGGRGGWGGGGGGGGFGSGGGGDFGGGGASGSW